MALWTNFVRSWVCIELDFPTARFKGLSGSESNESFKQYDLKRAGAINRKPAWPFRWTYAHTFKLITI